LYVHGSEFSLDLEVACTGDDVATGDEISSSLLIEDRVLKLFYKMVDLELNRELEKFGNPQLQQIHVTLLSSRAAYTSEHMFMQSA
jgi:hypothetical protein